MAVHTLQAVKNHNRPIADRQMIYKLSVGPNSLLSWTLSIEVVRVGTNPELMDMADIPALPGLLLQ